MSRNAPLYLVVGLVMTCLSSVGFCSTITGVNLNKRTEDIFLKDYDKLQIRWFRTYVLMLPYMDAKKRGRYHFRNSIEYKRLMDLKKLQDAGKKTIVSFRWDFKTHKSNGIRIPSVGSKREREYFEAALEIYDQVGKKAEIIVVGNEPMYETLDDDLDKKYYSSGSSYNPAARFYRRLAHVIHQRMIQLRQRKSKSIYLGALNDLDNDKVIAKDFIHRTFSNAKRLSYIDGVDFHTHARNMVEFERALKNIRGKYRFSGNLISTEYSIVFAFRRHYFDSLCAGASEKKFCDRYGFRPSVRELDFINEAISRKDGKKFSSSMWLDFYKSRSYLPRSFLLEANALFNRYGVELATFAAKSPRKTIYEPGSGKNANPWVMNGIFSPTVLDRNRDGSFKMNPYYSNDFPRYRGQRGRLKTD